METQTPFLQITRLLVEAREEIPRPRWTFFPPFNFCAFRNLKKCRCRIVVVLLCCCVVVSGISDVLCRSTCARSVHASFVLVRACTYRTIVHTYCAALSCTVLFCSVLQVTIHISLLVHIRTGAQHHTSHITTPLSLYETTRHIPPDLFRSQPKKKPLTSPTPNHHGNISSIPAQHGDGDHPQPSQPLGLISCILVCTYRIME